MIRQEAEDAYQAGLELWATPSPGAASMRPCRPMMIRICRGRYRFVSDAALSVSSDADSIDADDGATDPLLDLAEQAAPKNCLMEMTMKTFSKTRASMMLMRSWAMT